MDRHVSILLVEDDLVSARVQEKELVTRGYAIQHVRTGEEALHLATRESFDLILMDIHLGPGMDGTEAAEEILKHREVPIVFLSAHTEADTVKKTEKVASYGYIVKGTEVTVLDASIKMALKLFDARMQNQQAQAAARESEKRFRVLSDILQDEVHLWKVVRDERGEIQTWRLVDANQVALQSWAKTRAQTIGKTAEEIWPDANPTELFMPIVEKIFSGEGPQTWERHFPGTNQTLRMTTVGFDEYFFSTGGAISNGDDAGNR